MFEEIQGKISLGVIQNLNQLVTVFEYFRSR